MRIESTPTLPATARLIVAGYTGRDAAAVQHHIDELAAIGVPPPASVPAYYPLATDLVSTATEVTVEGTRTSGEIEPVLIRIGATYWLTLGSDHTDRALERDDIARSKAVCPKPIGRFALPLGETPAVAFWDEIRVRSWADGELYQDGTLATLRPLAETLARCPVEAGDVVLFGGTMPLLGGAFRYSRSWEMRLDFPGADSLELTYSLTVRNP
jgi:Protein of unknown function (DUF2848)